MLYVQSPNSIDVASSAMRLFLAGSIDSGMAEDWQTSIVGRLRDLDVVVFNPRRAAWPTDTPLESEPEILRRQINWELDAIERSDLMAFYFAPGTKAPVSLLELGLSAHICLFIQVACVSSTDSDQPFAAVRLSFLPAARDRIFCRSGVVQGE
jgi:Nucleoside 2-deoxyribosyltransferase like